MCDTFCALPSASADGALVFGKNSDRESAEGSVVRVLPPWTQHGKAAAAEIKGQSADRESPATPGARRTGNEEGELLRCTYVTVPQAAHTHGVILCQPVWTWGAEMGVNDQGVCIGNEAVYPTGLCCTPNQGKQQQQLPQDTQEGALLGMDLVRLGLERGDSAGHALKVMTALLEEFGQGGEAGFRHKPHRYDNTFLIADRNGAWILETRGKEWVAKAVDECAAISNAYSLNEYDCCSSSSSSSASPTSKPFYNSDSVVKRYFSSALERRRCMLSSLRARVRGPQAPGVSVQDAMHLLANHSVRGQTDPTRGHFFADICMHAGAPNPITSFLNPGGARFAQTCSSMVVHVARSGLVTAWCTATSSPCLGVYKPIWFESGQCFGAPPLCTFNRDSVWWKHEVLRTLVELDYAARSPLVRRDMRDAQQHLIEIAEPVQCMLEAQRASDAAADRETGRRLSGRPNEDDEDGHDNDVRDGGGHGVGERTQHEILTPRTTAAAVAATAVAASDVEERVKRRRRVAAFAREATISAFTLADATTGRLITRLATMASTPTACSKQHQQHLRREADRAGFGHLIPAFVPPLSADEPTMFLVFVIGLLVPCVFIAWVFIESLQDSGALDPLWSAADHARHGVFSWGGLSSIVSALGTTVWNLTMSGGDEISEDGTVPAGTRAASMLYYIGSNGSLTARVADAGVVILAWFTFSYWRWWFALRTAKQPAAGYEAVRSLPPIFRNDDAMVNSSPTSVAGGTIGGDGIPPTPPAHQGSATQGNASPSRPTVSPPKPPAPRSASKVKLRRKRHLDADCVVVGGGISGLTAAWELAQRGYSVLVLEARDRLGGRVFSAPLNKANKLRNDAEATSPPPRSPPSHSRSPVPAEQQRAACGRGPAPARTPTVVTTEAPERYMTMAETPSMAVGESKTAGEEDRGETTQAAKSPIKPSTPDQPLQVQKPQQQPDLAAALRIRATPKEQLCNRTGAPCPVEIMLGSHTLVHPMHSQYRLVYAQHRRNARSNRQRVDLGGQWLGPTQTRAIAQCQAFGLPIYCQRGTDAESGRSVIMVDGQRTEYVGLIPTIPSAIPGVPDLFTLVDMFRSLTRMEAEAATVPPDAPWEAEGAQDLDDQTVHSSVVRCLKSSTAKGMIHTSTQAIWACEPSHLSWLYMLFYIRGAGSMDELLNVEGGAQELRVRGGTMSIAEGLAYLILHSNLTISDTVACRRPQRELPRAVATALAQSIADSEEKFVSLHAAAAATSTPGKPKPRHSEAGTVRASGVRSSSSSSAIADETEGKDSDSKLATDENPSPPRIHTSPVTRTLSIGAHTPLSQSGGAGSAKWWRGSMTSWVTPRAKRSSSAATATSAAPPTPAAEGASSDLRGSQDDGPVLSSEDDVRVAPQTPATSVAVSASSATASHHHHHHLSKRRLEHHRNHVVYHGDDGDTSLDSAYVDEFAPLHNGRNRIILGAPVVAVENPSGVAPPTAGPAASAVPSGPTAPEKDVQVYTEDGRVYRASFAILATPPKLTSDMECIPDMPAGKAHMLEALQAGSVIKCIVGYDTDWWSPLNGLVSDDQGPVRFGFDASYQGMPALVGFITGSQAVAMSAWSEDERREAVTQHLAIMLDSKLALKPTAYFEQDWVKDDWAKGCYVGLSPPGMLSRFGQELRTPWGAVHFAGTETATVWPGYIEGAMQAGVRAAHEVMARL